MKTETENKQDDAQNDSAVRDCPDSSGSGLRIKYRGKIYDYGGKNFLERLTGIKGFVANSDEIWWCRDENCEVLLQNSED